MACLLASRGAALASSRAGYSSQDYTVEGKFMGELSTQYASQQAAGGVAMLMLASDSSETGSSSACRRASASGRRGYTSFGQAHSTPRSYSRIPPMECPCSTSVCSWGCSSLLRLQTVGFPACSRATGTRPPVNPELQALEAVAAGSRSTDCHGLLALRPAVRQHQQGRFDSLRLPR